MTSKRKIEIEWLREQVDKLPELNMREQITLTNGIVSYMEQLNRRLENIELGFNSLHRTKKEGEE